MRACLQRTDFMQTSIIASLHSIEAIEIRGVSRRSVCPCSRGILSFATLCCQDTVRIMLLGLLCPTKPSKRAVHGAVLLELPSVGAHFCVSCA